MCHLYPYNNVKLLRKFFYINNNILGDSIYSSSNAKCTWLLKVNMHGFIKDGFATTSLLENINKRFRIGLNVRGLDKYKTNDYKFALQHYAACCCDSNLTLVTSVNDCWGRLGFWFCLYVSLCVETAYLRQCQVHPTP